ncbi:MAG: hypothetical protein QOC57_2457, partial [Ilumatobacteraceae bacterium]
MQPGMAGWSVVSLPGVIRLDAATV